MVKIPKFRNSYCFLWNVIFIEQYPTKNEFDLNKLQRCGVSYTFKEIFIDAEMCAGNF